MLINLIVLAVTLGTALAVAIWLLSPVLRSAIEAPKFGIARWDCDDQPEATN